MLTLSKNQVCVWQANLNPSQAIIARLERSLSSDEIDRADRYAFPHLRRRFVVARGVLRSLLGGYLGLSPHEIRFCYGENGKPALAGVSQKQSLHFNLSHSDELALFAFTWERKLGIDVEQIKPLDDILSLAEQYFSQREYEALLKLAPEHLLLAFYACWTRKEAFVKAEGTGITRDLRRFDVSAFPFEPAKLLSVGGEEEKAHAWRLEDLSVPLGYRGVVAVFGNDWVLRQALWQDA